METMNVVKTEIVKYALAGYYGKDLDDDTRMSDLDLIAEGAANLIAQQEKFVALRDWLMEQQVDVANNIGDRITSILNEEE